MPVAIALFFVVSGILISGWLTYFLYSKLFVKTRWIHLDGTVTGQVPMGDEGAFALTYRYEFRGTSYEGKSQCGSTENRCVSTGSLIRLLVNPSDPAQSDKYEPFYLWAPVISFCFGISFVAAGVFGLLYPDGWPG